MSQYNDPVEPWEFGLDALDGSARTASALRRVQALALALESAAALDALNDALELLVDGLAAGVGAGAQPTTAARVGQMIDLGGRPYVQHARHVGTFNAAVPEYTIDVLGARANGTVEFPIVYEGPPNCVHGGFLALFFDCVVQHHNCDVGVAGKTTSLTVTYRRPASLLTPLTFDIDRTAADGRIRSVARLVHGERVLCEAVVEAVAGDRANLPLVDPRR